MKCGKKKLFIVGREKIGWYHNLTEIKVVVDEWFKDEIGSLAFELLRWSNLRFTLNWQQKFRRRSVWVSSLPHRERLLINKTLRLCTVSECLYVLALKKKIFQNFLSKFFFGNLSVLLWIPLWDHLEFD